MAKKKTLGHVELEWTCPACGGRNLGSRRTCEACGLAMPDDVAFEVGAGRPLDTSAETAARVAVGPDITCPYCGARNRGDATACRQCGGDLSDGARRKAGGVLGAYSSGSAPEVICPHCGATNPGTALACSQCGGALARPASSAPGPAEADPEERPRRRLPLVVVIVVALLACVGLYALMRACGRTEATTGTVIDVEWTYSVAYEERGPVEYEAWRDEVPSGAHLGECIGRVRRTVDEPVPGATEECGTPYVEDTGTGQGRVVEECVYHVPDDWCRYTVQEWRVAGEVEATGHDFEPRWPGLAAHGVGRRESGRTESYRVVFEAPVGEPVYRPDTLEDFRRFVPGTRWEIAVNRMGAVVSAEPAR